MLKGIKLSQKLFKIKKEYLEFAYIKRETRIIQIWWKQVLYKRWVEKANSRAILIQKWYRMNYCKGKYDSIIKSGKIINRFVRGFITRRKMRIMRLCLAIIDDIVQKGTIKIFEKVKITAATSIQAFIRGYFVREAHYMEVYQIKKAKYDFIRYKKAKLMQKVVKGFISRRSYLRLKNAAVFIQGHMKMKWLSVLFQQLRFSSRKIQQAVRRWYIRRMIVKERLNTFKIDTARNVDDLKIKEQIPFFGINNIYRFENCAETTNRGRHFFYLCKF